MLYDKSLSEWTSKYTKNKRELERVCLLFIPKVKSQVEHLRTEAQKYQEQVEDSSSKLRNMEDRYFRSE